jgi:hypothetical protein
LHLDGLARKSGQGPPMRHLAQVLRDALAAEAS